MKRTGNQPIELDGRKGARGRQGERAEHKVSDDIHDGCGDDLVESVLKEAAEPSPEQPFHFRNDEKRNEDGSNQHANRGRDEPIGDDDNRDGLSGGKQNGHDDVDGSSEEISPAGRVHARFKVATWDTTVCSWA